MVVDIPANTRDALGNVIKGPKATKALYPDDPSNVYHSYIGDHTKFRILHGGVKEHHIHHQHAHQWVHTPNSDDSSYDDSQAIGPGAAFTLETTAAAIATRRLAIPSSTATSIPTLPRACGACGARMMSSKQAPSSMPTAVRP
jgi:hypothetical protein